MILAALLCASLTACISDPYYQPVYGYPRTYSPQYPTHWEQRANYSPAQNYACNNTIVYGVIKYVTPRGYVVLSNGQLFDNCVKY